jgi:ParB family chromosome partitioning protein
VAHGLRIHSREDLIMANAKNNTFGNMDGVLGSGVDALFSTAGAQFSHVYLDEIVVKPQIREIFEDEGHSLAEFADSIRLHGVLQPILLRKTDAGHVLVAGERRFMAARLAGLEKIPAYIREMTDGEAEDAQFAENVHRKNLTQMEAAKKLQRDVQRLGSVQAVLKLHSKSKAWLSKALGLLDLPDQSKRLVAENISADVGLINMVKTIEKADPAEAMRLVDTLKSARGKKDARDMALLVKNRVKPVRKAPQKAEEKNAGAGEAFISMPWDIRQNDGAAHGMRDAGPDSGLPAVKTLRDAYRSIVGRGETPKAFLKKLSHGERSDAEDWLHGFYANHVVEKIKLDFADYVSTKLDDD